MLAVSINLFWELNLHCYATARSLLKFYGLMFTFLSVQQGLSLTQCMLGQHVWSHCYAEGIYLRCYLVLMNISLSSLSSESLVRHTTTPQQTTNQSKTTPYSSTGDKTTSKPTTKQRETFPPATQQPSITWPTINMDLEAWKSRCYNYVSFSTAPSDQASFLDTNTFIHANL